MTGIAAGAVVALTAIATVRVGVQGARDKVVVLMPDLWETMLAVQAADHGRQLVGAWSRVGVSHPGPLWFWWAAPFVRLSDGHPSVLAVAAAVLAATALVVAFLAARSAIDGPASLVVASALALGVGQLSTQGLAAPWNPTVVIVPLAAAIVCLAVVIVRGTTWPAVAAVLFGTLVAQAHLSNLFVGLGIVGAALVAWRVGAGKATSTTPRWHGTVLLLAVLLPWVPVAVDQVAGDRNAGAVARYVATGEVDRTYAPEPTGPSFDFTLPGTIRQLASVTSLAQDRTALWAGVDLPAGQQHDPSWWSTLAAVALIAVALAAARPDRWRRGSTDVLGSWICRVGLVGFALELVTTMRIRHELRPYLVAGAAGVGLALWIGVALVTLHAVRTALRARELTAPRRALVRRVGAVAVVLGSLVVIGGYDTRVRGYEFERPGDAATLRRVEHALDDHQAVVQVPRLGALQPALTLTAELERGGTTVAARGRYRAHFSDLQRQTSIDDADRDVWVVATGTQPPTGCRPLGSYQGASICVTDRS